MIPSDRLEQINNRIDMELCRSISKHGMWDGLSYNEMLAKVFDEACEVDEAIDHNDHHGPHGTFNELAQVAACCKKMMNQVLEREPIPV